MTCIHFNVLPRLGAVVAKDREAYQYLVESIRKFPNRRKLAGMMEQVRVRKCRGARAVGRHCRAAFRLAALGAVGRLAAQKAAGRLGRAFNHSGLAMSRDAFWRVSLGITPL